MIASRTKLNRTRVKEYFESNPETSIMGAARALGLARATVHYHLIRLRAYGRSSELKASYIRVALRDVRKRLDDIERWISGVGEVSDD